MEKVTITDFKALYVIGIDEDGVEIPVVKYSRIKDLKIGDVIQGYFLNDDEDLDEFYFEAVKRA